MKLHNKWKEKLKMNEHRWQYRIQSILLNKSSHYIFKIDSVKNFGSTTKLNGQKSWLIDFQFAIQSINDQLSEDIKRV